MQHTQSEPALSNTSASATTVSSLRTALMNVQMELDETITELNRLRLENASLKAAALSDQGPKKNKRIIVSGPIDYRQDLLAIANRFTLLDFTWVKLSTFQKPCPLGPFPVETRYSDDITTQLFIRYRLYECIPSKYHDYILNLVEFGVNYCKYAQAQRSTILTQLRGSAIAIFADTYPETTSHLSTNPKDHGISEVCSRLYMSGGDSPQHQKFEALLAPILYAGGNVTVDNIFQNEVLFLIGRCSLYGTTAIKGNLAKNSQGYKWGLKSATSGIIAFCCITAIFLLSNDVIFEEVGAKSGINYGSAFLAYKQRLEMHEKTARFQKIIHIWNSRLLGDTGAEGEEFNFANSSDLSARSAAIDAALAGGLTDSEPPQLELEAISGPTFAQGAIDLQSSFTSQENFPPISAPTSSASGVLGVPSPTIPCGEILSQPNSRVFTIPTSNLGSVLSLDQDLDNSSEDSAEDSDGPHVHHRSLSTSITHQIVQPVIPQLLPELSQPQTLHASVTPAPPITQPVPKPARPLSSISPTVVTSPEPTPIASNSVDSNQSANENTSAKAAPKRGRPKKAAQVKGQDVGNRRSTRNQRR